MKMKKILFVLLAILFAQTSVFALDVIYPTSTYAKINSPSTFFVGSVNRGDKLFINDKKVEVYRKKGTFAQSVPLSYGRNEFKLVSGSVSKTYIIDRPSKNENYKPAVYYKYDTPKVVKITRNGAPIRSTSVQSGINRISHFQKGINLKVIGELGNMYKVELSPVKIAWVAKSDVKVIDTTYDKATLFDYRTKENDSDYIFEFAMSKQTPYSITEGDVMSLNIYNVSACDNNTATFNIKLNQQLMGYDLKYKGDTLVLTIKKSPILSTKRKPLKNVKIVIDAGHGGKERGAISCSRNYEKDFNLSISKYLDKYLKKMGAKVYMTRNYDRFVSLNDRVKFTNSKDAQIFVSIHSNSLPDSENPQKHRGSSVYYFYNEAKPLSDAIINSVANSMNVNTEGTKQASFCVVRNTSAVSVLVETAYVINPYDNELLLNDNFRQKYAKAVAKGIKNYVRQASSKTEHGGNKKITLERIN